MLSSCQRVRMHRASAGFTLVELMTVVAITGILATIGVVLVRGHVNAAKASRALVGIQAIRVAEEQYRAQGGQYLGCSSLSSPKWYPVQTPGTDQYDWRQSGHPDWACWRVLGIPRDMATQYGYLINAGLPGPGVPGEDYPTLLTATDPLLPTPATTLWYVIQVKGNIDGDTTFMQAVATSHSGEVYVENESE